MNEFDIIATFLIYGMLPSRATLLRRNRVGVNEQVHCIFKLQKQIYKYWHKINVTFSLVGKLNSFL